VKSNLGKIKRNGKIRISYAALTVMSFLMVFPVFYMFTNSLMDGREIMAHYGVLITGNVKSPGSTIRYVIFRLIPDMVSLLQYYQVLLRKSGYLMMFWNSIILTVPIVTGQMVVASMAAFAFSKLRFPFREQIFFIYIIVMLMPFQVTLVPNYIILKKLNLLETYSAIILPGMFSTFGVFLLRQFMRSIPGEYCDAGKVDGVGHFRMFINIILPQCKGALASLAILVFIDNWNMVEQPLVFLKDKTMYPMSVFLNEINMGDMGIAFACGMIFMLPALLLFLYGESYFVEGIQMSGIK
jgi:multiple sugar transport system permease protein